MESQVSLDGGGSPTKAIQTRRRFLNLGVKDVEMQRSSQ